MKRARYHNCRRREVMNATQERLKFWCPCTLSQLEVLQGTNVTNPCCQQFAQSYVIGTIQSGRGILQYRNTRQEITRGAFYVKQHPSIERVKIYLEEHYAEDASLET